ncbi:aminoglycoside phosphotransferase family protein [Marinicella meishanensis]|uniref:aminoglycoside phosphotransferase family protein n=1 Tax=Marinicella meishanensis TaxID=2873263 RepID=UPI001CBDB73A|nr:phosphotransferase [Marinicella sp. NBU2979]
MNRKAQRQQWLAAHYGDQAIQVTAASEDASFRSYYRVSSDQGSHILMDAPPEHEDCHPFVAVQQLLIQHQIAAPQILAQDLSQGFLLLSDLGSTLYLDVLTDDTADHLYQGAMDTLVALQAIPQPTWLPLYDAPLLRQEMQLCIDWFVQEHLGLSLTPDQQHLFDHTFELLAANALAQPQVLVHRDYHSRNLMVLGNPQKDEVTPGVIDFQDAVWGPLTYDMVSLLRDCYISWEPAQIDAWCHYHWQRLPPATQSAVSFAQYQRWFDLMGMQRHLKAIGIFCRLNYRDGKAGYLHDIPRTLKYVLQVAAQHPDLQAFGHMMADLQPKLVTKA